jgi:CrcB protein
MQIALVGLFGIIGVYLRYLVNVISLNLFSHPFPIATITINLLGSFFIGAAYVVGVEKSMLSEDMRIALLSGLLGGFTTYSAFSLEIVSLLQNHRVMLALAYVAASVLGGVLCCYAGFIVARRLF